MTPKLSDRERLAMEEFGKHQTFKDPIHYFCAGWDARQSEIDKLRKALEILKKRADSGHNKFAESVAREALGEPLEEK